MRPGHNGCTVRADGLLFARASTKPHGGSLEATLVQHDKGVPVLLDVLRSLADAVLHALGQLPHCPAGAKIDQQGLDVAVNAL